MIIRYTPERILLLLADCSILILSLYVAISLRYGYFLTDKEFLNFLPPFLSIIFLSVLIFYIYGLYDKPTLRLIRELNKRIFTSQILTTLGVIILFYSMPILGISPKTILLLYITISSILMSLWRRYAFSILLRYKKQKSVIIGSGKEFKLLVDELSRNPHIGITIISIIDVDNYDMSKLDDVLKTVKPNSIIIDMRDKRIKSYFGYLYTEMFEGSAILDIVDVYEDVFDMTPTDLINQEWIFRNIESLKKYSGLKRLIDLIISVPIYIFVLIFIFPFVYLAIKIEDGGPIIYTHKRVGLYGKIFSVYKIRSMENLPTNELKETKKITKVGAFIRKTRIDELPQLLNVIKGDISLIGPRPETPSLVNEYSKTIPFYNVRHVVRPGLSGWAQIHQHSVPKFGIDIEQTSIKLAYDMYYLEHRNLLLDLSIILKTAKVLLSKSGV